MSLPMASRLYIAFLTMKKKNAKMHEKAKIWMMTLRASLSFHSRDSGLRCGCWGMADSLIGVHHGVGCTCYLCCSGILILSGSGPGASRYQILLP